MKNNHSDCDKMSDGQLVQLALRDVNRFSCLYNRYEKRMLHFIIKVSGSDEEIAKDILQDSFIKVWKNLNSYDDSLPFSSWLYRIVHNETISHWRKSKNFPSEKAAELNDHLNDNHLISFSKYLPGCEQEQAREIRKILNIMKKSYRDVIILKYFENLSYEAISDILKIPEGTVATRLNRARINFKKLSSTGFDLFE